MANIGIIGLRSLLLKTIRDFFHKEGFLELQTPLLVPSLIPESYLEYFRTDLIDRRGSERKMYLAASPEASIKKLLASGTGNCFEITRAFRNTETDSRLHNPEFTILEWYRIGVNYEKIMDDSERLMIYIINEIRNQPRLNRGQKSEIRIERNISDNNIFTYQKSLIDLSPPWERITLKSAFEKYTGLRFEEIIYPYDKNNTSASFKNDKIIKKAVSKGYKVTIRNSWEEVFNQIFLNEVEPNFIRHSKPVILSDYPLPMAALAKSKPEDPRFAERFEIYMAGLEVADCYSELTNYPEQKRRFDEEMELRKKMGKMLIAQDNGFLESIRQGLPECAGIAMGLDRLVMLFSDSDSISSVCFPYS